MLSKRSVHNKTSRQAFVSTCLLKILNAYKHVNRRILFNAYMPSKRCCMYTAEKIHKCTRITSAEQLTFAGPILNSGVEVCNGVLALSPFFLAHVRQLVSAEPATSNFPTEPLEGSADASPRSTVENRCHRKYCSLDPE